MGWACHAELRAELGVFSTVQGRVNDARTPLVACINANRQSANRRVIGQIYLPLGRSDDSKPILTEGE